MNLLYKWIKPLIKGRWFLLVHKLKQKTQKGEQMITNHGQCHYYSKKTDKMNNEILYYIYQIDKNSKES